MEKGSGTRGSGESTLRKVLVPTIAGAAGTAVAVALTKKPKQIENAIPKVREAIPDLPAGGVGEIADDLRTRLESVLGKESGAEDVAGFEGQTPKKFDTAEFERARAQRRKRREQRRRRAA